MAESLDKLVNNLPEDAFKNLKKYYTGDKFSLVKRKGVYPYEYMDKLERLKETKLPPKEVFYSKLKMKISVMKIMHTLKKFGGSLRWNIFKTTINYTMKLMYYY